MSGCYQSRRWRRRVMSAAGWLAMCVLAVGLAVGAMWVQASLAEGRIRKVDGPMPQFLGAPHVRLAGR